MRTKRIAKAYKCNFCDKDAVYDAPTINGQWGYMCKEHLVKHGHANALNIGTKFVIGVAEPKDTKAKLASTVDPESAIIDARRVKCPDCSEERSVEPDAEYEFNCEGCGIKLKCIDIMCEL